MKRDRRTVARLAVLGSLLFGVTASIFAHHSRSMYDLDKTITLECTITEVDWGNPHVLVLGDAKEDGSGKASVTNWNLEGPSPNTLESKGLKADTVKVGDKIIVAGHPRKDGRPHMLVISVTDVNGKHYAIGDSQ
jgi:hypothetical protein